MDVDLMSLLKEQTLNIPTLKWPTTMLAAGAHTKIFACDKMHIPAEFVSSFSLQSHLCVCVCDH